MISFSQFLQESSKFDLEKFKTDCAFILNEIAGTRTYALLYRGTQRRPVDWSLDQWTVRTEPRNTPVEVHNAINKFFVDSLGVPARSWQFATGDEDSARNYTGHHTIPTTVIFPVGKFEWVSGPIRDFTMYYNNEWAKIRRADVDKKLSPEETLTLALNYVTKEMGKMKWEHNTNLLECIDSQNEIMFKCDKYYSFNIQGETYNDSEFNRFLRTI